ncbi:MAG: carboxypeptidase regulatory-like domain-containing protein [Leptospiraceae bacterium]|nr:carboxypeptidase regulatory-like domain-containing protein [Leptospiraceae bacterium]
MSVCVESLRSTYSTSLRFIFLVLSFSVVPHPLWGQGVGTITGTVLDAADGQPIIGAQVVVEGRPDLYGVSDIDGNYTIRNVPEGTVKLIYRMPGYQTAVDTVKVSPGKTTRNNVALSFKVQEEMVVTAKRISNTAAALLTRQKKAAAAQDAISAEQIAKSPDNDAADAAKRVTGVSIVGNGNIYIRGMADRYSVVQVNKSLVPSPIQTRRTVPLDIFPVALLDNLTIIKTYLPEYQGEFGAGIIEIETRDYPEEGELKVGLGMGMNTITTGRPFGTYRGGKLDYLGFDDGTRRLPERVEGRKIVPYSAVTGTGYSNPQLFGIAQNFQNVWTRQDVQATPAAKFQASYARSYNLGESQKLGFLGSIFWQNNLQTVNGVFRRYLADRSIATDYTYHDFTYSTIKSAQLGLTFAPSNNTKYRYNGFYTHKSSDTTRQNIGQYDYSKVGTKTILAFWETHLLFNQLSAEHKLGFLDAEWKYFASFSLASRNQPDTRVTRYTEFGVFDQSRNFTRYFFSHGEQIYQAGTGLDIPFAQWSGLKSKFSVGLDGSARLRETTSRRFQHDLFNVGDLTQRAEVIFVTQQPRIIETTGTSAAEGFDAYNASLFIGAGYAQVDMPLVPKVRLIGGSRVEIWQQKADSFNLFDKDLRVSNKIEAVSFMPALSLVFSPLEDLNIRLAGSQTINRPDFIEASNFRVFDDLVTGAILKGNPELTYARITSADARFEFFPTPGEVIAISGFYKEIRNPIEASVGALADDLQFTYVNQEKAILYGSEFEIRKNFSFLSESLRYLSFLTNFTLLYSEISLNPNTFTAETNRRRPLQGQSPWLFNAGLYWDYDPWGTSLALLYNIFGRRIVFVGVNGLPNTYEEPYPTLDVVGRQRLTRQLEMKLTVSNILDPQITQNQGTGAEAMLIERYRRGINVAGSLQYAF